MMIKRISHSAWDYVCAGDSESWTVLAENEKGEVCFARLVRDESGEEELYPDTFFSGEIAEDLRREYC